MPVNARVLVVEDDPDNRQTLSVLLTQMGHSPTETSGGEEALRALEARDEFDIVVSDVVMPGMSGIDFANRARAARPGMPIVLVTGDPEAVDEVLRSGAVALLKPYTFDTLRQIIAEALERRD